jgi:hypothetical protein
MTTYLIEIVVQHHIISPHYHTFQDALHFAARSDWGIYNFKAELAYKGTSFNGWQIQNGKSQAPTIQDEVERALAAVKQERRAVGGLQGAGRTDSGVHARGQVSTGSHQRS